MNISIGIVVSSISRQAGGLFVSVRRSAQTLSEMGCKVTVYAPSDAYSAKDYAAWLPLEPKVFPRVGPTSFGYGRGLGDAIGHHDVVHLHGIWQHVSIAADSWRVRTRGPVIVSPRGMLDEWALNNAKWKKRLASMLYQRRNLRRAACTHALNRKELRAIRGYGVDGPVAVIPNGVDVPDSNVIAKLPVSRLGSEAGRSCLLYLGRIHPKKGIAETLKAWAKFKETAPDLAGRWRLVCAGWDDGGHLLQLKKLGRELGLEIGDEIVFPGPVFGESKEAMLRDASAFLLASHSEGLPVAVLEAWAYGLPVFMTEACNLSNGYNANAAVQISTDPERLAEAFKQHLAREDLGVLGENGRRLVAKEYSWEVVGVCFADLYRWVLESSDGYTPSFLVPSAKSGFD